MNRKNGEVVRYQHQVDNPESIGHDHVSVIYEDRAGTLWIGTLGGGLNRFDRETGGFYRFRPDPKHPFGVGHNGITAIVEDGNHVLWIGTDGGGLDRMNPGTGRIDHFGPVAGVPWSLSHNHISAIFEDSKGLLWIGTSGGGLNSYDPEAGHFTVYRHESEDPKSLCDDHILNIMEDQAGILWFGSENGISTYDRKKHKFAHYRHHPGRKQGLNGTFVSAVFQDRSGNLWVGTTNSGLNRFDSQTDRVDYYVHDPNDPDSIGDNTIYSIFEDKDGVVWVGSQNGGLDRFDRQTGAFSHFRHDPQRENSLSQDFVWPILQDKTGAMWVGTWGGGLNKFNPDTGKFIRYEYDPGDPYSLSNNNVASLLEDAQGRIWVGTFQGLNRLDPKTGRFARYSHNPDDQKSLSNNSVVCLLEDRSGRIWLGTLGGLNLYNPENETFSRYRKKDGLPSEVITSIMEDKQGNLWIATFNGVSKFDPQKVAFTNFDEDDGLQSRRFKGNAHFRAPDGQMFLGGINGLNAFYPEQIKINPYLPPIVLTDFRIFNNSVKPGADGPLPISITEAGSIALSYHDSVFSFEFSSLHYSAPDIIQYAYKLEGFDKDWLHTDAGMRIATYTNIDGGKYTFRVKGTNSDGIWNEAGSSVDITIAPPFWKTDLFALLMACIAILVIAVTVAYLIKLNREITERKKVERALRESEKKYRDLFENIFDIYYHTDQVGRITLISPSIERYFGYSANEITGRNIKDFYVDPEERTRFIELLGRDGFVNNFEARVRRKDGSVIWLSTNAKPLSDENGALIGVEGISRDVTELKHLETEKNKLESRLFQSQKMESIGTLAGGIAHDFNNILSPIMAYSELILMDLPPDNPIRDNMQSIYKAGERARDMVKQILTFARKGKEERNPVKASMIVEESVKFIRSTIPSTIEIQYSLETENDTILVDPTQVNQILMNLCTNAAQAMRDKGGKLTINLTNIMIEPGPDTPTTGLSPGHYLKLSVGDTGPGIPSDIIDKIFEPYFTTKAPGEGTGMGLALIHGIVKSYGGEILVTSKIGEGTVFQVLLPVVEQETSSTTAPEAEVPKGDERILLVDDEKAARDTLQAMLERLGYRVTAASNGLEALNAFKAGPGNFDLVITDQTMPALTGKDLTVELQIIRPEVPIILCTGFSDLIDADSARNLGIRAFLMKPIVMREMAGIIREILDSAPGSGALDPP